MAHALAVIAKARPSIEGVRELLTCNGQDLLPVSALDIDAILSNRNDSEVAAARPVLGEGLNYRVAGKLDLDIIPDSIKWGFAHMASIRLLRRPLLLPPLGQLLFLLPECLFRGVHEHPDGVIEPFPFRVAGNGRRG